MPSVRRTVLWSVVIAGVLAPAVAGCASAPPPTPAPTPPPPTPAPTATPLAGLPLAAGYRPEGSWVVAFSRPGAIVRETYNVTMTCPDGTCDAIVEVLDGGGTRVGTGMFVLGDDRYRYEATTEATVDCTAGGRTVPRGATERVTTVLVLATYRLAGTARDEQAIEGSRTVEVEPAADSGCAPGTTVFPARGDLVPAQP